MLFHNLETGEVDQSFESLKYDLFFISLIFEKIRENFFIILIYHTHFRY